MQLALLVEDKKTNYLHFEKTEMNELLLMFMSVMILISHSKILYFLNKGLLLDWF